MTLTPEGEQFLLAALVPVSYKQGDIIQAAGEVTRNMIHVNTGCLMTFFTDKEGNDQVIQFATTLKTGILD